MDFKGKVAIVTGAAGGTGIEIADRFMSEGIDVVMADLADSVEEKFEELKAKCVKKGLKFEEEEAKYQAKLAAKKAKQKK